uniref:SH3 domain-containing protein n=1 Tax=Candidozyma auris TaxID=498019 RepID=A0A0L0P0I8_CANAR
MPTIGHQLKNLKISSPSMAHNVNSKLRANVILVAKYDFVAESASELTIKKGDVLKLLDKLANGWVLVKSIERVTSPGLVPCLYVDIAVNDPLHPITLQWLQDSGTSATTILGNTTFYDAEVKQLLRNNEPITINNRPYPLAASITNFLMYDDRYWYRIDITYSTQEVAYLCRYYQDFYNLHLSLLDHVRHWQKSSDEELPDYLRLPKLPEPIPSNKRESSELRSLLVERCKDLDAYINQLILNKHYQVLPPLLKWLDCKYEKAPGFIVPKHLNETNDVINERVLPGSVKIYSKQRADSATESERLHAVLDKREEEDRAKKFPLTSPNPNDMQMPKHSVARNVYNHYQQALVFQNDLRRAKTTKDLKRSNTTKDGSPGLIRKAPFGDNSPQFTRLKTTSQRRVVTAPTVLQTSAPPPSKPVTAALVNSNPFTRAGSVAGSRSGRPGRSTPVTSSPNTTTSSGISTFSPPSQSINSSPATPNMGIPQLKCQIKTQSQEKLLLKLNKADVTSLAEFKRLVYQKIVFNNLFINLPLSDTYEEMDADLEELFEQIKASDNINILVT